MSPKKRTYKNITPFSKRLIELRKGRQLTQDELAEKIGVSRSLIGYYEAGAKNPTLETLQKLAAFFGVSISDLAEESNKSGHPGRTSKLENQVKRIQKLSPLRQRMISNMLEAALDSE